MRKYRTCIVDSVIEPDRYKVLLDKDLYVALDLDIDHKLNANIIDSTKKGYGDRELRYDAQFARFGELKRE